LLATWPFQANDLFVAHANNEISGAGVVVGFGEKLFSGSPISLRRRNDIRIKFKIPTSVAAECRDWYALCYRNFLEAREK
jgi:hypothetical protein